MKILNANELRKVAGLAGVSEKCVERTLGSVRVESDSETMSFFEIGFRLDQPELFLRLADRSKLFEDLASGLREYRNKCPVIAIWLGSGGFNSKKLPERANTAMLLHASRTASRLRARIIRSLSG